MLAEAGVDPAVRGQRGGAEALAFVVRAAAELAAAVEQVAGLPFDRPRHDRGPPAETRAHPEPRRGRGGGVVDRATLERVLDRCLRHVARVAVAQPDVLKAVAGQQAEPGRSHRGLDRRAPRLARSDREITGAEGLALTRRDQHQIARGARVRLDSQPHSRGGAQVRRQDSQLARGDRHARCARGHVHIRREDVADDRFLVAERLRELVRSRPSGGQCQPFGRGPSEQRAAAGVEIGARIRQRRAEAQLGVLSERPAVCGVQREKGCGAAELPGGPRR